MQLLCSAHPIPIFSFCRYSVLRFVLCVAITYTTFIFTWLSGPHPLYIETPPGKESQHIFCTHPIFVLQSALFFIGARTR